MELLLHRMENSIKQILFTAP